MIKHGVSRAGNPFWGHIDEPGTVTGSEYVHFNGGWINGAHTAPGLPSGSMGYFYCHEDCIVGLDHPEEIPEAWFESEGDVVYEGDETLEEVP
jgi:hypothetical protein